MLHNSNGTGIGLGSFLFYSEARNKLLKIGPGDYGISIVVTQPMVDGEMTATCSLSGPATCQLPTLSCSGGPNVIFLDKTGG